MFFLQDATYFQRFVKANWYERTHDLGVDRDELGKSDAGSSREALVVTKNN